MKKSKMILSFLILLTVVFSMIPSVISQKGTYQFHGAEGDQKILKVRTVNSASLTDLFGANWTEIIELFGEGATNVNARYKSVVVGLNHDSFHTASYVGTFDAASIIIKIWFWTTDPFDAYYDSLGGIQSLYDPTAITTIFNTKWTMNVTMVNTSTYFGQLPTPVDQYLGQIVWEDNWKASGNTVIHQAKVGEIFLPTSYQYLENCTETWTYDETDGTWIGYKVQDSDSNTIYEFSIELTTPATIPGFELPVLVGTIVTCVISVIYISRKKKKF